MHKHEPVKLFHSLVSIAVAIHCAYNINRIEAIQRHATRSVFNDFSHFSIVYIMAMLHNYLGKLCRSADPNSNC